MPVDYSAISRQSPAALISYTGNISNFPSCHLFSWTLPDAPQTPSMQKLLAKRSDRLADHFAWNPTPFSVHLMMQCNAYLVTRLTLCRRCWFRIQGPALEYDPPRASNNKEDD